MDGCPCAEYIILSSVLGFYLRIAFKLYYLPCLSNRFRTHPLIHAAEEMNMKWNTKYKYTRHSQYCTAVVAGYAIRTKNYVYTCMYVVHDIMNECARPVTTGWTLKMSSGNVRINRNSNRKQEICAETSSWLLCLILTFSKTNNDLLL